MTGKLFDAFDRLKASGELKESTRRYLQENAAGRERVWNCGRKKRVRAAAAVCLVLFLAAGGGGYYVSRTPYSYISIDVNPSMELALNRFDRVVDASAYNEDAVRVLEDLELEGESYGEAIACIMKSNAMREYLNSGNLPYFTVASDNSDRGSEILRGVESSSGYRENGGHGVCTRMEFVDEAHENNLSFGKYAAYCELSQFDDTVTLDDCHGMTMTEIHERIRSCQGHGAGEDDKRQEDGAGHSGCGVEHGGGNRSMSSTSGHHGSHW